MFEVVLRLFGDLGGVSEGLMELQEALEDLRVTSRVFQEKLGPFQKFQRHTMGNPGFQMNLRVVL